jgi:hypothetical protein
LHVINPKLLNFVKKVIVMKHRFRTLSLAAALSGLAASSHGQIIVWSQNFDSLPLGTYGAHTTDFNGGASPANNIVAPGFGGSGNAMALTFNAISGTSVNLQTSTLATAPSGATSANLSDYTLSFDMAIQGVDITTGFGGLQISVQGNDGGIFGQAAVSPFVVPGAGTANSGFQHYSFNLGAPWTANGGGLQISTDTSLAFGIGVVAFGNSMTASPETLLVDNIQISMVPEPSTYAILFSGLGLFVGSRRLRRA